MRLFWFSCSFPVVRQNQKPYVGEWYSALLRIPSFHLTNIESLNAEEDLKRRPVKVKLSIPKTNTV